MSSELYCVPHNVYLIPHNGFCSHWQRFQKLAIFGIKIQHENLISTNSVLYSRNIDMISNKLSVK